MIILGFVIVHLLLIYLVVIPLYMYIYIRKIAREISPYLFRMWCGFSHIVFGLDVNTT
jgi:hypothetical protein